MKQLTCEMCGSNDLLKQDGVFVCQNCGTKYSVEEAKKMMIEGTVDVSGSSVRIDQSKELENLYALARRSKDNNDSENGAKYYAMILEIKPDDWEAAFYSMHFRNHNIKIGEIRNAMIRYQNALRSSLELVKQKVPEGVEQKKAVQQISEAAVVFWKLMLTNLNSVSVEIACSQYRPFERGIFLIDAGDAISDVFNNDSKIMTIAVGLWKLGAEYTVKKMSVLQSQLYNNTRTIIERTIHNIQRYDNNYQLNIPKNSACYVATCVYGSYDCPQVWTLRRYRDYTLAETWYGRAFIRIYYAVSPTIVKLFGNTKWFKKMWRGKLDRMVADLQAKGVENTPYNDREW